MRIKVRDYEVRLARSKEERKQVRQLRYEIFVEEEGASATEEQKQLREEYDSYDRFADYMIVLHKEKIIGTYRIISRESAEKMGGFYTETEYNISKIKKASGNIAEMSRAAVHKDYREEALAMRMLWLGLGDYISRNDISLLFGIASWVGTNSVDSAQALSYLYYNHLSPLDLRATVATELLEDGINPKLTRMNILPKVFVDKKEAYKQMTSLVKGYLRLGATFGKGVFIESAFNSYEVFVIVETNKIAATYQKHFTGSTDTFDRLALKTGPMKIFGKIVASPFTGSFKILKIMAELILGDDAKEVEYLNESDEAEESLN